MKTREGIYFGNREIVERYVGNKLVWQKEIVLLSGKASVSGDSSRKSCLISIGFDESFKNPDLEPYNIIIKNKEISDYKDNVIIKNSYIVINNVKYKDVTIYFSFYSYVANKKEYHFLVQFPTYESYYDFYYDARQHTFGVSATLIARKR